MTWLSQSIYVNTETGEIINKTAVKKGTFIITKINRNVITTATTGFIKYTIECKRNPQYKLFTTTEEN